MSELRGVESMTFETFPNKAMGDEMTDDSEEPICPFTKTLCPTPYLSCDCWNNCPRAHRYEDW